MGSIYNTTVRLLYFVLSSIPPRPTFRFSTFTVTPAKDLKDVLEINNHLDGAVKLLEGLVHGPEHLLARKDEIYTGIHGEVIKLTENDIAHIANFEQPCGLAFDTLGNNLIVADIYNGLWEVDLSNGNKKLLVSAEQELDGKIKRKPKAFNAVVVDNKGDIYWTDSSSDNLILAVFNNPSGRLFHYDRTTNENKCLMDELFYANGVTISPNEDFLVVAETGASRLLKYHLKGPKKGQHEVFVDDLPGTPDNLTSDNDGIWIPLFTAKDAENPSLFATYSEFPMIRLFITRLLALFMIPLRVISYSFPNAFGPKFTHFVVQMTMPMMPKRSTIVRVDWNGNIVGSLHGFDRSVGLISHVLEFDDQLLLGSPHNQFIAKVKLPKSLQDTFHKVIKTHATVSSEINSTPVTTVEYSTPVITATITAPAATSKATTTGSSKHSTITLTSPAPIPTTHNPALQPTEESTPVFEEATTPYTPLDATAQGSLKITKKGSELGDL